MSDTDLSTRESGEFFPIRTVSAMTGVNAVTLRAWERRYGLVSPARTDSGHRVYSSEDVRVIRTAVQLLERGVSIGRIARIMEEGGGADALQSIEIDASPAGASLSDYKAATQAWSTLSRRVFSAVYRFDESELDTAYNEALALFPVDQVTERLVLPTLRSLGEQWRERSAGIAEEHFFTTFLRNKLGARFHHLSLAARGPRLLTACLSGERHELGLLMFALAAAQHGYRVVMMGHALPAAALAPAVLAARAQGVVLSASMEPEARALAELAELAGAVDVPVMLGGCVGPRTAAALEGVGVEYLGSSFAPALMRIDERVGTTGMPS